MKKHTISAVCSLALLATACSGVESPPVNASSEGGATTAVEQPLEEAQSTTTANGLELQSGAPDSLTFAESETAHEDQAAPTTAPATTVPAPATTVPAPATTDAPAEVEPQSPAECEAPALEGRFVDVALDDPDGGLNFREAPSTSSSVITTFRRGVEVISTGECVIVGGTDWWEVLRTDGSESGWVSSRFLSAEPLDGGFGTGQNPEFAPSLGAPEADRTNLGLSAPTLEGLVALLAQEYGFGEDVEISPVGEFVGIDPTTQTATYDLVGLEDDSLAGYRVDLLLFIDRDVANGDLVTGFTAINIVRQSLCARGVGDDGLCI